MLLMTWFFIAWTKVYVDSHYFDGYSASTPLNAALRSDETLEKYRRVSFTYDGLPGNPTPALMILPKEGAGPFPALVFLHGNKQEKEFLDEIGAAFAEAGFAIASFDQYMQGERKLRGLSPLQMASAMHKRGSLTITEARRMVDYLETRPDIAKDRIYLIGASYGAVTGAIAGAREPRFRAICLVYGGGGIDKVVGSLVRVSAGPVLASCAQGLVRWLVHPSDPVDHVGKIAPRPILFLNGEHDRIVIPLAAKNLFDAANQPKEIKWYPSDHLDLDPQYIAIAVNDGITWFKAFDATITSAPAVP